MHNRFSGTALPLLASISLAASMAAAQAPDNLTAALTTGTPEERIAIIKSLQSLGDQGKPALPALIRAMENETDSEVAGAIIGALGAIGIDKADELDQLIRVLKTKPDSDAAMRVTLRLVSWAKSKRPEADKAIPALIGTISSKHLGVRAGTAVTISAFGGRAKDALPALEAQYKAEPEIEGDVNAKAFLIGAIITIYDAIDPVCGAFLGDNGLQVEFHRDFNPTYEGRITIGGNEYRATAPVANGPITGTFKLPDGNAYPFTFSVAPDGGAQLKSGNSTYRLARKPKE